MGVHNKLLSKHMKFAVTPLVLTPFAPFGYTHASMPKMERRGRGSLAAACRAQGFWPRHEP